MTTLHKGYVVALTEDIREDDAESIINAIRMVKGVMSVKPIDSDAFAGSIDRDRERMKLWEKVSNVFFPGNGP